MDPAALEFLYEQGITLLIFPPNCTPILQMLDFGLFGIYKQNLRTDVSVSNSANFAETIAMHDLSALTFEPWMRTATPERIKSSFAGTGVFPLNAQIPLERMKSSPSALVYDVPRAIASVSAPPAVPQSPPPLIPRKRPPSLGDLRSTYPTGESFKKAKLDFDQVRSDRNLSLHFNFFVESNWATIGSHFENAVAYQIDNTPDIPLFDNPDSHPSIKYPKIGSHIEDILQLPRTPTFGKKQRAPSKFGQGNEEEEESAVDDGPRIRPFGVMTTPQIIKAKKDAKEQKLQREREKERKAEERRVSGLARSAVQRDKNSRKMATLEEEKPIWAWIAHKGMLGEEEISKLSKKRVSKEVLLSLAAQVGLLVPRDIRKENLLDLLLDNGSPHA